MSPKPATCHQLLTGQCVCRSFLAIPRVSSNWSQAIKPQAAEVLQAPNIFLNYAGVRTLKSRQAYAVCFFFYMIKTCSK